MERTEMDDNLRSFLFKDFIIPSENPNALEGNLVARFVYGTDGKTEDFYKDVISLVLAQLGDKKGTSFDTFVDKNGPRGRFSANANKLSLNEELIGPEPQAYSTLIASHETYHKHQSEVNKKAKLFSRWQDRFVTSSDDRLGNLLGFTNSRNLYYINNAEKQAYTYDGVFIKSFLGKAYDLAHFMKDPVREQAILEQQAFIEKKTQSEQKTIENNENLFIARNMPKFYAAANSTFNNLVSYFLDIQANSKEEVIREHGDLIARLSTLTKSGNADENIAAFAMTLALGGCPKKENVQTFIDALTTSRVDVGEYALRGITHNRVPITQGDFTRLSLSTNNTAGELPKFFTPELLDRVDETTWAKNLVLTVGKANALSLIEQFKSSGEMPNTDFNLVEKHVASYSDKPLLTIGGTPFYNCRDILQFVSTRESAKYAKFQNNIMYYQNCGVYSESLANVITHFDNPSADNEEFVSALSNFVQNPRTMQFEDKETRSEISAFFTPKVSEELAKYIGKVREQGTENHPEQTEYTPVTQDGKTYEVALEESANELSKVINDLARNIQRINSAINEIGIPVLLERLGIKDAVSVKVDGDKTVVHISEGLTTKSESKQEGRVDGITITVDDNSRREEGFAAPLSKEEIDAMINGARPSSELDRHTNEYLGLVTGLQMSHEQIIGSFDTSDKMQAVQDARSGIELETFEEQEMADVTQELASAAQEPTQQELNIVDQQDEIALPQQIIIPEQQLPPIEQAVIIDNPPEQ